MDDKPLTVEHDGSTYEVNPLDEGQIATLTVASVLPGTTAVAILSALGNASFGEKAWSSFLIRLAGGGGNVTDLVDPLLKVVKAQFPDRE